MMTKMKLLFLPIIFFFASFSFADTNSMMLLHQPGDPIAGNPNGKVSVVEFFDYQCSHCMSMAAVITAIIQANPDVRIVFKDFPIRGPMSDYAARAALAANKQGKYYPFSHALLTTDQFLTEDTILSIAQKTGVNVELLKKDINTPSISQQISNTYVLARALDINATPAFYVGPTNATDMTQMTFRLGELSQPELQTLIDKVK